MATDKVGVVASQAVSHRGASTLPAVSSIRTTKNYVTAMDL